MNRVVAMHDVGESSTPLVTKRQIVADALRFFREHFPEYRCMSGPCLPLAISVIVAASKRNVDLILQAGSCFWRRVEEGQDDGVEPTHFGYEWQGDSRGAVRLGQQETLLPEIHVWAADPRTKEIVDLSTRFLPAQCEAAGMSWKSPRPPRFLWTAQVPAHYAPDRDAIHLVGSIAHGWVINRLFPKMKGR